MTFFLKSLRQQWRFFTQVVLKSKPKGFLK